MDSDSSSEEAPEPEKITKPAQKRVGRAVIEDSSSDDDMDQKSTDSTQKLKNLKIKDDDTQDSDDKDSKDNDSEDQDSEKEFQNDSDSENKAPKPTHKTIMKSEKVKEFENEVDEDGFMVTR